MKSDANALPAQPMPTTGKPGDSLPGTDTDEAPLLQQAKQPH